MPKALCMSGIVISALVLILFLLDLALSFPFGRKFWLLDVVFVISSLALGFLSWMTLKEQDR